MQINSISYNYNVGFNALGRSHLKNGNTALAEVKHNEKGNIKDISVKILKKHHELDSFSYQWEKGISYDEFLQSNWPENICRMLGIKESSDCESLDDAIFEANINEIFEKKEGISADEYLEKVYLEDSCFDAYSGNMNLYDNDF